MRGHHKVALQKRGKRRADWGLVRGTLMEQKVGGTRMGRSAEGQLVKGPGPSQRGATSNHVERGSRQRGRGRPQKTRPPTSVPFPSTYTFSSPHVVSAGQCVGAQKRKHQECREIRARGSRAQPNGAQTMSSFIPATLWSREVQSARENRPQKPFLCALA